MKCNVKPRKRMPINFRVFRYVWERREGNGIGKGVSTLWNIFFLWKQIWKGKDKNVKSVDGGYMCVYYPLCAWDSSALKMYKLEILMIKKKKAETHQRNQSEVVCHGVVKKSSQNLTTNHTSLQTAFQSGLSAFLGTLDTALEIIWETKGLCQNCKAVWRIQIASRGRRAFTEACHVLLTRWGNDLCWENWPTGCLKPLTNMRDKTTPFLYY